MSDLISRADAMAEFREWVKRANENGETPKWNDAVSLIGSLPSAETHDLRTETHGVCLISKDDAMGAVQDHFNANGFKGYDDGQKMMDRINALPSAELPKGDLISRADAIEAVCDGCVWYKTASCEEGKEEWECSEVNKIRHLPSADAVQGEWVLSDNPNILYECSNCGHGFPHKRNGKSTVFYFQNYCPNCGARMKGGAE